MLVRSVAGWGSMTLMASLRTLALLSGVSLDVSLARAGDAEGRLGHVLGDHRAGRGVGVVAQLDGRHEGGVHARLDALAQPRAGLALRPGVVVRRNGGGAEVGLLADVGVPDVGEMRDLRLRSHVGVLDLHERARLAAVAKDRARAQAGVGADDDANLCRRALDVGVAAVTPSPNRASVSGDGGPDH